MSSPSQKGKHLSEQDAASSSQPTSRRPSSSRPELGDRQISANTLAALRDQFEQYGSPPKIPNIPPRASASATEDATPSRALSPESSSNAQNAQKERMEAVSQALSASPARDSPMKQSATSGVATPTQSGIASSSATPAGAAGATSIEELTDAQKARIVGMHLVDKQGQRKARQESQSQNQEAKSSIADMLKNALFKSKNSDDGKAEEDAVEGQVEGVVTSNNPADFPVSHSHSMCK